MESAGPEPPLRRSAVEIDNIPPPIREVMARLVQSGFDVWLVGGVLRDWLSGTTPKDWDLATSASPQQVIDLFPRVVPVGIRHGTVQVHTRFADIEVTSCPGAGLEGILADLERRDFTVNAMALAYPSGELLDPHGGRQDLGEHRLKAVGNARLRFREDPLRILRAARFVSVQGFRMDRSIGQAMKWEAEGLVRVAQERIREEMFKALMGRHVVKALERLRRSGALQVVLPELEALYRRASRRRGPYDPYRHTLYTVHYGPARLQVRLAALLHRLDPGPRWPAWQDRPQSRARQRMCCRTALEVMQRWRMSNKATGEVLRLLEAPKLNPFKHYRDVELRRWIGQAGPELLENLLELMGACHKARKGKDGEPRDEGFRRFKDRVTGQLALRLPLTISDLALTGSDVMQVLDLGPGPWVGKILKQLHSHVLENPECNERKILMDFLRKEYHIENRARSDQGQ